MVSAIVVVSHQRDRRMQADVAQTRAEIRRLDEEANFRLQLAEKLWQRERERSKTKTSGRGFTVEPADAAIDRAAFAMVYQADRIAHDDATPAAQKIYREVVQYFPQTQWAQLARERLAQ